MQEDSVPEEFAKVIRDFVGDLKVTFPEYISLIDKWWKSKEHFNYIDEEEDKNNAYEKSQQKSIKVLFDFCKKKLPPRFFDILYQNDEIFKEDSDVDTEFFPRIHFKNLWQCDITDKTRETIWKYLQLMLFAVVGSLENKDAFGDTAKLFEAINEDDFKTKLQETLSHMQDLFDISGNTSENLGEGLNPSDLPNAEQINEHITGMLDGKIGQLAREIAEETANNLNMDFNGANDMKDVFNQLIKNPTKMMGLIKTVGNKLDTKLKSGELKESEMIQEATEIMNKMKNMPGMENIHSMLGKMGINGLGGFGGKVNTGAMQAQFEQRLKLAKTKERIKAKAQANALKKQMEQSVIQNKQEEKSLTDAELFKIFDSADKPEKSMRGDKPQKQLNKKKKKGSK